MNRLPTSLLLAAIILSVTMAAGSYIDIRSDDNHRRQLIISTGLEKIIRFNQQLNTMLRVSVLEQNNLRSSSYANVHASLEQTFSTIEFLTQNTHLAEDILALSVERQKLYLNERKALELMEADIWDEARALLYSDDYLLARKIYEINSDTAIGALNGELESTASTFTKARNISLAVRISALGLLLWAGLNFSSRIRRELKEQERLRKEISATNLRLEDTVQERTAELVEANRRLANLSTTDSLTGLANRRLFDDTLQSEWQRVKRLGQPLTVMMIDVDNFKAYNDHFGHQAGDKVLKQIGTILKDSVRRSSDLAARYGGEEFVIILPHLGKEAALKQAESIRNTIKETHINHIIHPPGMVTVSIGIAACIPQSSVELRTLLNEADKALYKAKRKGRNTVCTSEFMVETPQK